MRKINSNSKDVKAIPYTPDKSFVEKMIQNKSVALNKSYINYHPQNPKRSNTPLLYNKINSLKCTNNKQNQQPKLEDPSANNRWETEVPIQKEPINKTIEDSTSYIVNENLRLSLYKSSRAVTLKHLNNLCNRSTPEIRQVMRLFCMLLNALKKPEYQVNSLTYKNWSFLWDYISKHNWTILAEVIAVSNKIERGLYSSEAMNELKDQFDKLEIPEKIEPSFKAVLTFVKNSVSFFSSKQNQDHSTKAPQRPKQEPQESKIKKRTIIHKHSKSKVVNLNPQEKEEKKLINNYSVEYKDSNKNRSQVVSVDKKITQKYKINDIKADICNKNSNINPNERNSGIKNSESKENHVKMTEKRINPKRAQANLDISFEKESKFTEFAINYNNKELNESVWVKQMPVFNVDQLPRMMSEDSQNFKTNKEVDNDCVLFDSYRKYESEYEQELKIRPEQLSFKNELSDTESESNRLELELKQCEYTSDWSSAMTPRMVKNWDNEDEVNIHSEIELSQSFSRSRLSPEQISRIKEITNQRKIEVSNRNSGNEMFGNNTPLFTQNFETHNQIIRQSLNNSSLCNIEMIESDREFWR